MAQTKEVMKKEAKNELAQFQDMDMSVFGTTTSQDILIPKLLAMQGLSDYVTEEKAQMGDIVNSVTGEVLAGKGVPINFVPLTRFKTWARYEQDGAKLKYVGTEPDTGQNYKWEEVGSDGKKYRNDQVLNFYILLEGDLQKPFALPYLLTFKRTSYTAGKKLNTQYEMSLAGGYPPFVQSYKLQTAKEQNDHGTFYVWDVRPGAATDQSTFATIQKSLKMVTTQKVNVHDEDEETPTTKDVGDSKPAQF